MTILDDATTIVREISINAPAAKVFAALTQPEQMVRWWGDDNIYRLTNMEADVRVGGRWRTVGRDVAGEEFYVEGEYRTIDSPVVLEYTWRYSWAQDGDPQTVVRFDLDERDGATHVQVTHSGFADAHSKHGHDDGWVLVLGWLRNFAEIGG